MACVTSQVCFMACVVPQVRSKGVCRLTSCFHGVCCPANSFSGRVPPHKFVFIACVATQVCFHCVCCLTILFPWRVSPSSLFFRRVSPKLVFTACVTSRVCSHGACRLLSSFPWRVSPLELAFGVCRLSH